MSMRSDETPTQTPGPTSVVIAVAYPLLRRGIRSVFEEQDDLVIVGEAEDGTQALELAREHAPRIILFDLAMPGLSAHAVLEELDGSALVAFADAGAPTRMRTLIDAGIAGYVLKAEEPDALVNAMRAVVHGGTWFSRAALQHSRAPVPSGAVHALTPREREVVEQIARGFDNRTVARNLGLAEQTIRNYVSRVYDKLDLDSRVELAVWAREQGMVNGNAS